MPRVSERRIQPNRIGDVESQRAVSAVAARPVGEAAKIPVDPEVEGLLRGLNTLQPVFEQAAQQRARQADADQKEGAAFGKAGGSRADAERRSREFLSGYLEGQGEAAGIADAEGKLVAAYESDFNKVDGDVNELIGKVYQAQMKGQNDPDFRRGYDRAFGTAATKLRAKHGETIALAVNDERLATAQTRIDFRVRQLKDMNVPLGDGLLQAVNEVGDQAALTGREKDMALYLTLKQHSRDGDASVWDVTKLPRVDSKTGGKLPSLYSNPFFKEKIDEEIVTAKRIALQKSDDEIRRLRESRQARQDAAMLPVVDLIIAGDKEGAERLLTALSKDRTLFTNTSELVNARNLVTRFEGEFSRPGEEAEETNVYLRIHEGKETQRSIMENGVLGQKAKVRALQYWRGEQSRLRQEAAAARTASAANENAWAKDPLFQADLDLIGKSLVREKGLMDPYTPEDEAAKVGGSLTKREFISWVAANPQASPDERRKKAIEIIDREQKVRNNPNFPAADRLRLQGVPFRTLSELKANAHLLDDQTLYAYMQILQNANRKP